LAEYSDEAEERAFKVVSEKKGPELPEEQRRSIARIVGVGAVKYADLFLPNRQTDYLLAGRECCVEWQHGAYLQYAYARIRSIFRKRRAEAGQSANQRRPMRQPSFFRLLKRGALANIC